MERRKKLELIGIIVGLYMGPGGIFLGNYFDKNAQNSEHQQFYCAEENGAQNSNMLKYGTLGMMVMTGSIGYAIKHRKHFFNDDRL